MIEERKFPSKMLPHLFEPKRFKVFYGGRSSAKSSSVARYIILRCHTESIRVLCCREYQSSIKGSVKKALETVISDYGLDAHFTIQNDCIKSVSGSEIIFEGLSHNTSKIKSLEGISICYCEESESISNESWSLLIPTIRKENSEIIIVFNPYDMMDATYQRFVAPYLMLMDKDGVYVDDKITVIRMNYSDNPFLPQTSLDDMARLKEDDYQEYLHVWEGQTLGADQEAIIKPIWVQAAIDAHVQLGIAPQGVKAIGFDPNDSSGKGDEMALVFRHGSIVTEANSYAGEDINVGIDRAFELVAKSSATDFVFDGIGVGSAVKVGLENRKGNTALKITNFKGSASVRNPLISYQGGEPHGDVFLNLRAQSYWLLRDRFLATYNAVEKNVYTDPSTIISLSSDMQNINALVSELSQIRRKRGGNGNGLIQIESKQDMKKRGMRSPNLADALVYSFSQDEALDISWNQPIQYNNSGYV